MSRPTLCARHLKSVACAVFVAVCLILSTCTGFAQVQINVQCDQPQHEVSERLIGIFFEDINFGADGGFNAELVKNGTFEAPKPMLGWKRTGESVTARLENESPYKVENPTFLRLRSEAGNSAGGAVNEGFRGMGVKQGKSYLFSMQARSTAGKTVKLVVRLVAGDDEVLAEQELAVDGSDWRKVTAELKPARTEAKARFEVLLNSAGLVDCDLISLCPRDTWKGRPHGLRKDLVQLLADLKPAFFRFPGGCIVEGSELKYRYQWKTTVGPRDERRLIKNRWNDLFAHRPTPDYYQSFNVGFFEFFQMAADMGAEPLPIINCGMACQFNTSELVPLEELQPYIQDALDLIEFANGPAETKWGKLRADMGHPEPFNLRLLGVGNEQWGPEYFERYKMFAEVLEREHPEVELISTSGPFPSGKLFDFAWPLLKQLKVPIVDEHCYSMPDWFLREATRYDSYDRNGPKVFMGEYAAQSVQLVSPLNRNTLRCALSEAAFLTGIERNCDLVTMSAYAPLMGHEEAWQWRPNLVWFDNLNSYGSPSYYVQQMFSLHRGDHVVPVEVKDDRPLPPPGGRIGLGSRSASVEFRNVSVANGDKQLFSPSDLTTLDQLTNCGGDWQVSAGTATQSNRRGPSRAMLGDYSWQDCTISMQARRTAGAGGISVWFRNGPGGKRITWHLGGDRNDKHSLVSRLALHNDDLLTVDEVDGSVETDRWYDLRIELAGPRVKCFLDDKLVHEAELPDPVIGRIFASASTEDGKNELILKVVNPTDSAAAVTMNLSGAGDGARQGKQVVLTGGPEDENSIEQPRLVSPKESSFRVAGSRLEHTFLPHSFTVLRVPLK